MRVLVVVDMQVEYSSARDAKLIAAIEREAERIQKAGGEVVAVNFDGSGGSTVALPAFTPTVWKSQADGGTELYAFLLGRSLIVDQENEFIVCGVNLTQCVIRTALGLADRLVSEHGMSGRVAIATKLCGDGEARRVRFIT